MSLKYKDLLHLPHPNSLTHPRMASIKRAAQFAPFAALSGYDVAINEASRETQKKIELDEEAKNKLDAYLGVLLCRLKERPPVAITFFKADQTKEGGSYKTITGVIKRINGSKNAILMENGLEIIIQDIIAIRHELDNVSE